MENFENCNLPMQIVQNLTKLGIITPTAVQAAAIPVALLGKDILASAQTGSGKTLGYVIPMLESILKDNSSHALILTPTRELAIQVKDVINKLLGDSKLLRMVLLIGGDSMVKQLDHLRQNPRIVIGTPGRVIDHLKRHTLKLDKVRFLILDEIDRMLDMGFSIQLRMIKNFLKKERQTLMFSATIPKEIVNIAEEYLCDYEHITIGSPTVPAIQIKQDTIKTTESEKYKHLTDEINKREGSILIFVKTKRNAEKLSDKLRSDEFSSNAIHGDLRQRQRERIIQDFRKSKNRIMVATDVVARGLDVPHIQHVINYDLPSCPEDYIHRIGRTGRAGAIGEALSLIAPDDNVKWRNICKLISHQNNGLVIEYEKDGKNNNNRTSRTQNQRRRPQNSDRNQRDFTRTNSRVRSEKKVFTDNEEGFYTINSDKAKPEEGFTRNNGARSRSEGRFARNDGGRSRPEGRFARNDGGRSRPEGRFARNDGGRSRPEGGFARHDGGRSRPEDGFARNDRGRSRPEGGFARNDGGRSRPEGGFARNDGGRSRPEGGFARNDGGRSRPEGGFARNDGGRSRPEGGFAKKREGGFAEKRNDFSSKKVERTFSGKKTDSYKPKKQVKFAY